VNRERAGRQDIASSIESAAPFEEIAMTASLHPFRRVRLGALALGLVLAFVLAVVVVAVCFQWAFPALAPHMPFNDSTVGDQ